jgi:hypothetical protein
MKLYIKECESNLRSSRCFHIVHKTDKHIIGQLIQDTQFSLARPKRHIVDFKLCWENEFYELKFKYIIDPENIKQIFEFEREILEISFLHKEFSKGIYYIYCPTIELKYK